MREDPRMDETEGVRVRRIELNPKNEEPAASRKHNLELSIAAWILNASVPIEPSSIPPAGKM